MPVTVSKLEYTLKLEQNGRKLDNLVILVQHFGQVTFVTQVRMKL